MQLRLDLALNERGLLGGAWHELVRAWLALLHEVAVRARVVEDGPKLAVAARFLVVARDAVTHELAEHEDGRLHVERHGVVLERAAVAVAHEVVDEARALGGVAVNVVERLLALRRYPGGEQDVSVLRGGPHQVHRHVRAELNFSVGHGDQPSAWEHPLPRRHPGACTLYAHLRRP